MQLLVSVRSAEEVGPALAGGADIIDAKEPSRGSLGPVDASVLQEISAVVPPGVPLSIALGDFEDGAAAADAIAALGLTARPAGVFVKLGLLGASARDAAATLFRAAVKTARTAPCRPRVVAVVYADQSVGEGLAPREMVRLAAQVGADAVLLDTLSKDGGDLFTFMAVGEVKAWVGSARAAGLIAAVAGSLRAESLARIGETCPSVVGVRRAACTGGRGGTVVVEKVRALRRVLDALRLPIHAVG
jgi:(5-formylfuran-3-yl)methyl phosphate synthase